MSRNTPPCSVPRPTLTSLLIARATSSRGSRSGVRRLFFLSSYQASPSRSVSAVFARENSRVDFNNKRSPLLVFSLPPSPPTPPGPRLPPTQNGPTLPGRWDLVLPL